jgi:hypothetical protein
MPRGADCQSALCRSAKVSAISNPTLCRVLAYFLPGFPKPTTSFIVRPCQLSLVLRGPTPGYFSSSFSVLPFLITSGSAVAGAAAATSAGAGSSTFSATTWTTIVSGSVIGFHLAPSV